MSTETPAPKKLIIKPIVISNQKMLIKSPKLLKNFKLPKTLQQYKDEVIYSSTQCDFLKGESQEVLIVNRLNLINKSCRTIARCTSRGVSVETTSDSVSSVIGQKNYETVLSALSSVFNEETKIRGILSLLTPQKKLSTAATQADLKPEAKLVDASCQTADTRLNMFAKEKQRKRIRRQPLTPYVVTETNKLKKFVINIDNVKNTYSRKVIKEEAPNLPDLKSIQFDEESNMSTGSIGNISLSGLSNVSDSILSNTNKFLTDIDKVTDKTLNSTFIPLRDGSRIMVPRKPEDIFHIAAPDILKNVTNEERMKLMWHQAFIDFKMCLEQDEDGYYPLHVAVLNNDVDLVRRQCASLRSRHESVDIPAGGLTALHIAVRQNVSVDCTKLLLQNGADPLLCDQERRCSFHLAAEVAPHLRALVNYCDTNTRSVLKNNLDYWRPEHESKTDAELRKYFYECVNGMFDEQGYTPLMIAAEAAIPSNVSLLAERAGRLVDVSAPNCGATALYRAVTKACLHATGYTPLMIAAEAAIPSNVSLLAERAGRLVDVSAPNCGATALYRAVTKACLHATETGNRTTAPEHILKTIEVLVEHGANPSAENHSGSSVNTLLTEFNISVLSMTIANKMTAMKHGTSKDNGSMMLYKNEDGKIGWLGHDDEDNKKPEMTVVRNIPPNLHAIVTIDVPKKPCCGRRMPHLKDKCCGKNGTTSPISNRIGNDESNDTFVNLKEMGLKVVTGKRISGGNDSKEESLTKDVTDADTRLKESATKLSRDIKTEDDANTSLNAANDAKADNLKLQQVKLGNVILNAKTNINLSIKDANDKSSDKNITIDPIKVNFKPITFKRNSSGGIEIKQTQMCSKISNDNSKDTTHTAVSNQIRVGNVIVKNLNENEKKFSIFQPSQKFKLIVKNGDRINMDTISAESTTHTKRNRNKREAKTDSNKPTRSAKERKLDKVVIVENVSLKKGFSMPNILKGGTSKIAKPRDIVITPKANEDSPKIVTERDDVESVINGKRKLCSE